MCTDLTKQEILYFLALWPDFSRNDVELTTQMKIEAAALGWPEYLVRVPRTVEALNSRALRFGFSTDAPKNSVRITEKGRQRLRHISEKYAPKADLINNRVLEIDSEIA